MMRKLILVVPVSLMFAAVCAQAAGIDGKTNLLCAVTEVHECDAANGCGLLPTEHADDIQHLNVDFRKKSVTLDDEDMAFVSMIESVESVDDKLVLQGIEDGQPGASDGGGWTMSIDKRYGTMIFTQAGGRAAFVGFGSCLPEA